MRRTLFVFPRDLLPAAWGSASARVAEAELRADGQGRRAGRARRRRRRVARDARAAVLDRLADGDPRPDRDRGARAGCPTSTVKVDVAAGVGAGTTRRVLTQLGAHGRPRARPPTASTGGSRGPRWTLDGRTGSASCPTPLRRGRRATPSSSAAGCAPSGPGTEADIVWWLGATKAAVAPALAALGAVEVSLDGGGTGWVLPDDVDRGADAEPWAALLPVLDPTLMGWKERGFYLGDHGAVPLRPQRQRRHDGVGGRARRRLLGAGRRRRRVGAPARDVPAAAAPALDARRSGSRPGSAAYASAASTRPGHEVGPRRPLSRSTVPVADMTAPSSSRRRCSGSGSATPSAAGCASPATATSAGPSSGRSSGPGCRWPTRRGSTPTRASRTPAPRRPGRPARPSTSRSRSPRSWTRPRSTPCSTRRCPTGSTCSRSSTLARRLPGRPARGEPLAIDVAAPPLEAAGGGRRRSSPTESVLVERMTKKGLREFDCRAAVVARGGRDPGSGDGARLDLVLRHGVPAVRPDDVLTGLGPVDGLDAGRGAAADPARAGPAGRGRGTDRRPASPADVTELPVVRAVCDHATFHGPCAIRPDGSSPASHIETARGTGRRQTATRSGPVTASTRAQRPRQAADSPSDAHAEWCRRHTRLRGAPAPRRGPATGQSGCRRGAAHG